MDENNQNSTKPTIDKEYLKKLAEKIKAEKARKEALGKKADTEPTPPSIASISSKYLSDDDDEEIASEKTAIIDLSALSGHAADAKLTIVDGKDSGKNIEITKDEILAGRSLDNDFVISDISVSRKHFKIKKEGERFVISDMGSGNGIKVNGSKTTSTTLSDGDIISVGARQIKFEILNPDLKPKVQAQRVTKQNLQPAYDVEEDDEPVKKGSSPLVLVAIIVVILIGIGGVAYFMLFDNQNSKPKTTAVSASFGENDKAAIEKLIAAKDLKNAEKTVLDANSRTSGDNPYKQWLNEQTILIGREKTNQTTFENAKKVIQKNPEEAEKLLKSIPSSSIFYKDAQNLLLTVPAKSAPKKDEVKAEPKKEEPKTEPKKEEPKAEPKKETPKKAETKKAETKKEEVKAEPKKETPKAETKKEAPKKAETKKAEPKPAPEKKAKKATMSEEEAKTLYMEANAMKDENPEEAKKMLQKIINSVDPSSKRYKKAKELLEKL
ncbi:FHA domain-containing protein [bacterium]|nr:FHA domain-containing protein [bacterium]